MRPDFFIRGENTPEEGVAITQSSLYIFIYNGGDPQLLNPAAVVRIAYRYFDFPHP